MLRPLHPMSEAADITRKAQSNLAFALQILPKDRREDAVVFYAFCRVIDDLADDLALPLEARQQGLDAWRDGLRHGFAADDKHPDPRPAAPIVVVGCHEEIFPSFASILAPEPSGSAMSLFFQQ